MTTNENRQNHPSRQNGSSVSYGGRCDYRSDFYTGR